jgi:hypothetical protein
MGAHLQLSFTLILYERNQIELLLSVICKYFPQHPVYIVQLQDVMQVILIMNGILLRLSLSSQNSSLATNILMMCPIVKKKYCWQLQNNHIQAARTVGDRHGMRTRLHLTDTWLRKESVVL